MGCLSLWYVRWAAMGQPVRGVAPYFFFFFLLLRRPFLFALCFVGVPVDSEILPGPLVDPSADRELLTRGPWEVGAWW